MVDAKAVGTQMSEKDYKDYGEWAPFLSSVDEYRAEQDMPSLTDEQIAEATKAMDRVIADKIATEVKGIACLPDRLIEVMLTKINDMDLLLDFITLEEHAKNHERINTILKQRNFIKLGT